MKKLKVLGCYGIPTNAEIAGINSALEDNDLERALDIVKESKTLTAIFIKCEEDDKSKIVFYYCGEIYNDFSDVKKWQKSNPVDEHFHKETQEDIECLLQKLQRTKGPWYCFAWYATLTEEIMMKPLLIFGKPKFIKTERSVVKSISIISVPDFPHHCDEFVKIL